MSSDLDIWLGDHLVAHTASNDRGNKVRIVYTDTVGATYGPEVPLLSCSLPTPGPSEPAKAHAFLEGLLPEGRALAAAAAQVRGVRLFDGAPETPGDVLALLAEYGRECAGAVVVIAAGVLPAFGSTYELLDDEALARLIRNLPQRPLGTDLERDIRMSLGGAQDKLLLTRIGDRWYQPVDGAPSTHIIKPTTTWPHSAQNEALVLELGRASGLVNTQSWVEDMGDSVVLVAERYDRQKENGDIIRLHQEDMCQAIGLRPKDKYKIGRPSERMAKVLREFAYTPRVEIERMFRQIAFRATVGDEDGHGKNYSLLLNDGRVTLAPLYDSLCTLDYPELSGRMATPIGAQSSLANVDRAALLDEARAMGLTGSEAHESLDQLAERLRRAIENLSDGLTDGWPSERVIGIINTRIERLESGQPLGDPTARSSKRGAKVADRPTLDDATAAKQTTPLTGTTRSASPIVD
jgi:serine/threonine-protein kinase HipA